MQNTYYYVVRSRVASKENE